MRDRNQIEQEVMGFISEIAIAIDATTAKLDPNAQLRIILSESAHALKLLSVIEDEFEIEIEDDEINFNFFSDICNITDVVWKHLQQTSA